MKNLALLLMVGLVVGVIGGCGSEKKILDAQGHEIEVGTQKWDNGKTKIEYQYYLDGSGSEVRSGYLRMYFENGQMYREFTYQDGVLDGPYAEHDMSGTEIGQGTYKDGKEWTGRFIEYYDSGSRHFLHTYQDGILEGSYAEYDMSGTEIASGTYKAGKEWTGHWIDYYQSGKKYHDGNYVNGTIDGPYVEYYENGQKHFDYTYTNGIVNGPYVEYYENGNRREAYTAKEGKYSGDYSNYWEDGKVQCEGQYGDDGELIGIWSWFDGRGILFYREQWEGGIVDSPLVGAWKRSKPLKPRQHRASCNICFDITLDLFPDRNAIEEDYGDVSQMLGSETEVDHSRNLVRTGHWAIEHFFGTNGIVFRISYDDSTMQKYEVYSFLNEGQGLQSGLMDAAGSDYQPPQPEPVELVGWLSAIGQWFAEKSP